MTPHSVAQAQERLDARDPRGALAILAQDPDGAATEDGYYVACVAHFQMKDWARSEQYARHTLGQNPLRADASYYLGVCMERQNRPEAAIKAFQAAVTINPNLDQARKKLSSYGVPPTTARDVASPPGPKRPPASKTELTVPDSEAAWRQYEKDMERKKLIDARAEYRGQMKGLPWWTKALIAVFAIVLAVGVIVTLNNNEMDEIDKIREQNQQQACEEARANGGTLPPWC